jgi:hypothetical protein
MFGRTVLKVKPRFSSCIHFQAARSLSVLDAAYTVNGFWSGGVSLLQAAATAESFHVSDLLSAKSLVRILISGPHFRPQ